tara:strand:- start:325 stop:534 length:210 start_codon:yes stop_codon:yes gene_type:complete
MAYAYTVKFPNDGIIGVYSTMRKAEEAWTLWIKDHGYEYTVHTVRKMKTYQTVWFTNGEYVEIDRWYIV